MSPQLQALFDTIRNNPHLTESEKERLVQSIQDADKAQSMTQFKLERLERDKQTLTVMLEENIEDLQKKSKAIEAQNRELEIETSLEKVRGISLSMKEPADMLEVCRIISQQLETLHINGIRNVQTAIFNERKGTYLNYEYYTKHAKLLTTEVDYKNHPLQEKFATQMLKGAEGLFTENLKGEKLKDWYAYQKTTNQFADSYLENAEALCYYWYSLGPVALGMSAYSPLQEEQINLFKRFGSVFELAYRRFIDIELAISQAREARIETALERIRARALAMHTSEELMDVAKVLREQMALLGQPELETSAVHLYEENPDHILSWRAFRLGSDTKSEITYGHMAIPKNSCEIVQEMLTNFYSDSYEYTIEVSGSKQKEWYNVLFSIAPEVIEAMRKTNSLEDKRYYHFSKFSGGALLMVSSQKPSDETRYLQKRSAKVFDLAYHRFLDLQKTEAQAREAQIEAGLERVRSRSLAMHNTSELQEVIHTVHKELLNLNIAIQGGSFIAINSDIGTELRCWGSGGTADTTEEVRLPLYKKPFCSNLIDRIKKGPGFFTEEYTQEEKKEFFTFLFTHEPWSKLDANQKKDTLSSPGGYTRSCCVSQHTSIFMINHFGEKFSAADNDVLKRFAKVFEQSYTRFLDLQKAEAQAREAQIEAALERVRSRSMGMQKSEELKEVIHIVYRQLRHLKINLDHAGFVVDYTPRGDWHFWIADEQDIPSKITHPFFESVWTNQFNEAKEKGIDFFATRLNFEEKNKFYQDLLKYIPGLTDDAKEFYFSCQGLGVSTVLLENVGLYIENFAGTSYSDEENNILMRFGKVFQQTYTRFLDLQKAEAQAREAQVEASLERIRSQAMIMRKSEELIEVCKTLMTELETLGFENIRNTQIAIANDDKGSYMNYDYYSNGVSFVGEIFYNSHPFIASLAQKMRQNKETFINVTLTGTELDDWRHHLKNIINRPAPKLDAATSLNYYYYSIGPGGLGFCAYTPLNKEAMNVLHRFKNVFELTYQRYMDVERALQYAKQAELDLLKLKEEKKRSEDALSELQATQKQLIQSEKMASLGELTAGIAHEIQNPLNFVNNFSEVSKELLDEMKAELDNGNAEEAKEIANDVIQNLEKINHHGKRADGIVKGMLQHSRSGSGMKEPADINALCDEYLRLSYHGLRAKDKSFNATIKTDFDNSIGTIHIIQQDMGRVVLNLLTNAFYVVDEKKKSGMENYEPTVSVSTKKIGDKVEIRVTDNGNGIPRKVLDKIFQPFFTTKPAGQGTGLGLSLSYDIVTKGHGGELKVETREGEGTEFLIQLPG